LPILQAEEVFLGRQPILDRRGRLVAYELLFRAGCTDASHVSDDLHATASVISLAFGHLGVHAVLGPHLGFINVSAELLFSDIVELLPKEQIVLELLETVVVTDAIVARCVELKARGFGIALDDFVFSEAHVPLLELADVVKIDLQLHAPEELAGIIERLRRWPLKLLAEKVDSQEQARRCRALGFDLFQGYYFAHPSLLRARRPVPAALPLPTLLELVHGEPPNIAAIELAMHQAPGLAARLLHLLNSAACSAGGRFESLSAAAAALPHRTLVRCLQLLPFTSAHDAPEPNALLQLAAGRARLMEILAVRHGAGRVSAGQAFATARVKSAAPPTWRAGRVSAGQAFATGVLSLADVLLGVPIDDVVARLAPPPAVQAALLRREGVLGQLLALAEFVEQADYEGAVALTEQCAGIDLNALTRAELEAMVWVNELAVPAA
jgi:EAL and modified HD-GYP domain-containing signal transduction protein